jgi:hypothetical protein
LQSKQTGERERKPSAGSIFRANMSTTTFRVPNLFLYLAEKHEGESQMYCKQCKNRRKIARAKKTRRSRRKEILRDILFVKSKQQQKIINISRTKTERKKKLCTMGVTIESKLRFSLFNIANTPRVANLQYLP